MKHVSRKEFNLMTETERLALLAGRVSRQSAALATLTARIAAKGGFVVKITAQSGSVYLYVRRKENDAPLTIRLSDHCHPWRAGDFEISSVYGGDRMEDVLRGIDLFLK